ncbi:MAG: SDR family oxidoreductase [Woeseiaceae bacterium]|nr:SDR family oxidoreductase [Woeseiaceae bacterium]
MRRGKKWLRSYGPWALVTGASDGIGREFARTLAEAGFDLILVARRKDRLEELAQELAERFDATTRVIEADLADAEHVARVIETTRSIDIGLLVASAGFGTSGSLIDTPVEDELSMLDVNCRAVLSLSHEFADRFVRQGRGGLVLLSSIVAFQGVPRSANYAATKAYVQSLAEGLRVELKPLGVDVIAAAPGPVSSGFAKRANMQMGAAQNAADVPAATMSSLGRRTTVRPGRLSKLLGFALSTLPRWGRVRVMTLIMGGMTKHQEDPSVQVP